MSRKFERNQDIFETLQKENRELKSENKALRKKLKQLNKGYYKFLLEDEERQEDAVETAKAIATKICYSCQVGELKLIILGNRYIRACDNCERRLPSKPLSNLKE